jgi:hypothetical protein
MYLYVGSLCGLMAVTAVSLLAAIVVTNRQVEKFQRSQSESSSANFITRRLRALRQLSTKRTRRLEVFVVVQLMMCMFLLAFIFEFEAQVRPAFDKWSVYIVCKQLCDDMTNATMCSGCGSPPYILNFELAFFNVAELVPSLLGFFAFGRPSGLSIPSHAILRTSPLLPLGICLTDAYRQ